MLTSLIYSYSICDDTRFLKRHRKIEKLYLATYCLLTVKPGFSVIPYLLNIFILHSAPTMIDLIAQYLLVTTLSMMEVQLGIKRNHQKLYLAIYLYPATETTMAKAASMYIPHNFMTTKLRKSIEYAVCQLQLLSNKQLHYGC